MKTFRVRCINSEGCTSVTVGKHYDVKDAPEFANVYRVMVGGDWLVLLKDRFRIIPEEKQTMQKDWREYTFNIKHTAQIDESQITEDLSWENPLFILQVEGSDSIQAFVADEVWTKAANAGKVSDKGGWPETKFERKLGKILGDFGDREIPMQDVPKLVKLIQKIKRAKWNGSQKRRVTVKRVQV